jgi:hypothetical protein
MTRNNYVQYDISQSSFEDFVDFLFDHEVVRSREGEDIEPEKWYWQADVTLDTRRVVAFYQRLFDEPEFLLARYTKEQLEQGFWAIMGQHDFGVTNVIWIKSIAFEERAACVRSMYHLYERLFLREPLETSSFMWWDSLAYDWHCDNRSRANGGEDEAMQDVMFETLERILDLPSELCQTAALHGLGHLHHPNTEAAIDRYLQGSVTPELRDYALAASRFEVL